MILSDELDIDGPRHRKPQYPTHPAELGTVVRHRSSMKVGTIVRFDPNWLTLRDDTGREHRFRVDRGAFDVNGQAVTLVQAKPKPKSVERTLTASGSVAIPNAAARIARPSRILVEGVHDAELIERVWGDDLRYEGVVVEPMHGADDLVEIIRGFGPTPGRKLGILLDHYIPGTKEWILAEGVDHPNVVVVGHPFVDVWQTIRPSVVGIDAWPEISRGQDWKTGMCTALGLDPEPGIAWKSILSKVNSYRDLEPTMVGPVEELIDFVTSA